jgi:prolyl 4-hydroxylase
VTRYREGQQYTSHLDAIDLNAANGAAMAGRGGQRVATLLVYLTDCASGGETDFDALGLRVVPSEGNAILFFPAFMCGAADPLLRHSALPVRRGDKWVLQLWARQRPLHEANRVNPLRDEERPPLPTRRRTTVKCGSDGHGDGVLLDVD